MTEAAPETGKSPMSARGSWWLAVVPALLAIPLLAGGCGGTTSAEDVFTPPAVTEQVKGTDLARVTLTAEAAKRLGIETVHVQRDPAGGTRTVIPYDAVLYDPDGTTWAYTSPKPLVFERADITVARITGSSAVLAKGPAVGMPVVTVGATEIWGVEYGGIEED